MPTTGAMLSELSTLLSAALGVNLAYLNLERFRYRKRIAEAATTFISNNARDMGSFKKKKWFHQILRLQSLASHQTAKQTLKQRWDIWNKTYPNSIWGNVFKFVFHLRLDAFISCVATFWCAAYLIASAARATLIHPELSEFITGPHINNELYYGTAFLLWPMLAVVLGKFCIWRAELFMEYQLDEVASEETEEAIEDIESMSKNLAIPKDDTSLAR